MKDVFSFVYLKYSAGCPLSQDHRSGSPNHLIPLSSVIFHLPPDFWPDLFLTHSYRFAYSKKMKDKKVILLSPTSDLCLLCSIITNRLQLSQAPKVCILPSQMAGVCFPLPSMAQPAQCSALACLSQQPSWKPALQPSPPAQSRMWSLPRSPPRYSLTVYSLG